MREAGQADEAMDSADRMLALERRLFGAEHEDVAGALEFAAGFHAANDDIAGALERAARGALDPRAGGEARNTGRRSMRGWLERAERLSELSGDRLRKYREGLRLLNEINQAGRHSYDVPEQIERKEKAVAVLTDALGEDHPESAQYLDQLGWLFRDLSRTSEARRTARRPRISSAGHSRSGGRAWESIIRTWRRAWNRSRA